MKIGKHEINDSLVWTAGGLLIAGAIVSGWYFLFYKKDEESESYPASNSSSGTTSSFCKSRSYPLEHGTCHSDVKLLQQELKDRGYNKLGTSGENKDGVDGMFGTKTETGALAYFGKKSFTKRDIDNLLA